MKIQFELKEYLEKEFKNISSEIQGIKGEMQEIKTELKEHRRIEAQSRMTVLQHSQDVCYAEKCNEG